MSHQHAMGEGRPVLVHDTKLTAKVCNDQYADWQAAQHVALAHRVVREGRAGMYRHDKDVFGQLVQVINGDKATITAGDGEESQNAFTRRVLAMLERYRDEAVER